MMRRPVPLCILAFIGLLLSSCERAVPTPCPRYTPQVGSVSHAHCRVVIAFFLAMNDPIIGLDRHVEQWNRWMNRVNKQPVSPESAIDRLEEFWLEVDELAVKATAIAPPREAREVYDLFLQTLDETQRAITLLQGYYQSGNVRELAEANAAIARAESADRQYRREKADLWANCRRPLPTVTP